MALSSMEEDSRVYHNARVLIALRKCVKDLGEYYGTLNLKVSKSTPILDGKPHPRYFPYPTSFTLIDGTPDIHFQYQCCLEDHPACVTYLAEITDENGEMKGDRVVVKFVASYGEEVHKFLASNGWAPTLRYCGPLGRESELSDGFPGPAKGAPPGLHLGSNMRMVIMDYIDALPKAPQNAREQINEVLTALHTHGYVFGDLRLPNVLFDQDGKVKLIDFNWCGRYDTKDTVNDMGGLEVNVDLAKAGDGPYAHYPLGMSKIEGMWAPGMEPLTPIRPQHDKSMMNKLLADIAVN
jgi:hypothetical protein